VRDPSPSSIENVVEHFRLQYEEDRANGRSRSLRQYVGMWPAFNKWIAQAYSGLESANKGKSGAAANQSSETLNSTSSTTLAAATNGRLNRVGDFKIVREIERGSHAVVYLATQVRTGAEVALKVLKKHNRWTKSDSALFQVRAAAVNEMNDPGLCHVHESGIDGSISYVSMDIVEGPDLAQRIKWAKGRVLGGLTCDFIELLTLRDERKLGTKKNKNTRCKKQPRQKQLEAILKFFEAAARSLQVGHESGFLHGNLKPSNIMIGSDFRPVLVDYGLCPSGPAEVSGDSKLDQNFGTLPYMAPEQAEFGRSRMNECSEVYSLAVCLFEVITLTLPHAAPTVEGLSRAIGSKAAPDPCKIDATIPRELGDVLRLALTKDPAKRYRTAEEFANDLSALRYRRPTRAAAPGFFRSLRRHLRPR
jgi:serine/threonine protein kinase